MPSRHSFVPGHLSLFLVTLVPAKTIEVGSSLKEWTQGPVKYPVIQSCDTLCPPVRLKLNINIAAACLALSYRRWGACTFSPTANAIMSPMKNFWPDKADVQTLVPISHLRSKGILFIMMDDVSTYLRTAVLCYFSGSGLWIFVLSKQLTCVFRWCIKWWSIFVSISIHVSEVCTGLPSNKWSFFPWWI